MKLENTLKKFVKSFSGNVMGIGIESQQITEALQKQEQISNCLLLDCYDTIGMQDTKKRGRNKKIPLKKLRKKVGKKKMDYILCHTSSIDPYWRYFIRDSVYMTSKKIIYYGKEEECSLELEEFIKRYKRYKKIEIETEKEGEYQIIFIHLNGAKNHRILDIFYFIGDSLYQAIQLFGDYLVQ